jgi:hypothetical protein
VARLVGALDVGLKHRLEPVGGLTPPGFLEPRPQLTFKVFKGRSLLERPFDALEHVRHQVFGGDPGDGEGAGPGLFGEGIEGFGRERYAAPEGFDRLVEGQRHGLDLERRTGRPHHSWAD